MPRVPQVERQVGPAALPGVRQSSSVNANTMGAGVWEAVGDLARETQRQVGDVTGALMARQERETVRQARGALFGAEKELQDAELEIQRSGGANARPVDGPSATQRFEEQATKIFERSVKGLSPEARERALLVWSEHTTNRRGSIQKWEEGEVTKADLERGAAAVDLARSNAAAGYSNPSAVREAIEVTVSEAKHRSRLMNESEEAAKATLLGETTKTHSTVLESMIAARDLDTARSYFEANKDQIDGRMHEKVLGRIQKLDDLGQAQAFAQAQPLDTVQDLESALDKARSELSGEKQEIAVREIKERFSDRQHIQSAEAKRQFDFFSGELIKANAAGREGEYLRAFSREAATALEPEHATRLISLGESLAAAQRRSDADPAENAVDLLAAKSAFDRGEKDLGVLLPMLGKTPSRSAINELVRYTQTNGNSDGVKASRVEALYRDLTGKPLVKEDGTALYGMVQELRKEYAGKEVPEDVLRKRIAATLLSGETKSTSWWVPGYGKNMTGLQAIKKGEIGDWLPDLKPEEAFSIEQEMRDAGVSEDAIKDENTRRLWKKDRLGLPLSENQRLATSAWRRVPVAKTPDAAAPRGVSPVQAEVSASLDKVLSGQAPKQTKPKE